MKLPPKKRVDMNGKAAQRERFWVGYPADVRVDVHAKNFPPITRSAGKSSFLCGRP